MQTKLQDLQNHSVSLNSRDMVETLNIEGWGYWASHGNKSNLGYKSSAWMSEIQSGWREAKCIPMIDPIYAEWLDRQIAGMDERPRYIIISIYAYRSSAAAIARRLKISRNNVFLFRDTALAYLYGTLQNY